MTELDETIIRVRGQQMRFVDWMRVIKEHPCPDCQGRAIACETCNGCRIDPDYKICLSDTVAEMEEMPDWVPGGPFAAGMVVAIVVLIFFIICAPILKEIS